MLTRRFLTIRDKGDRTNGHHRSKSMPPNDKRPFASDALRSIFKRDHGKHPASEADDSTRDRDQEKEALQIDQVQQRLKELNIVDVSDEHIRDILATNLASGNPLRAAEFIDMEDKASSSILVNYDPSIHLLGAVNRNAVTCYLDSLLFSMFLRLDSFECMLKNDFPADDPKQKLVHLLRVWVNMLRSGKLIETDLTRRIQDAIADCGWEDARNPEQQDTSEAFAFLTETLQLPLLPLQVDLFHHGRRDDGDSKVVHERLLNLAVPEDTEGKGIKLEDCLEEYFNTRVDVLRDSEVAKKSFTADALTPLTPVTPTTALRNTIRMVGPESTEGSVMMTSSPVAMSPHPLPEVAAEDPNTIFKPDYCSDQQTDQKTTDDGDKPQKSPLTREHLLKDRALSQPVTSGTSSALEGRPSTRHRSASVIQRVVIDESGRPANASDADNTTMVQRARRAGSTVVKAVTIPAWQFFRLIPWHALSSNEPQSDSEVAINFDQRPVVGICLKRYGMDNDGRPIRRNTFIDIPDSLRLPRFMLAEDEAKIEEEINGFSDYKLVLQSVICHRGDDLQSGHYYAFARVAPKTLTDNRRHNFDPPPDYEEAQWVKFDDLIEENRVSYVDDIKQAFKENMPYLLFYQIVPVVEVAPPSTQGTEADPPSYNEARVSLDITAPDSDGETSARVNGYFDAAEASRRARSAITSARASLDVDRGSRKSFEAAGGFSYTNSLAPESRRQSVILTDSTAVTPAITPDGHSPMVSPSDDTTPSRLSRAASRFAKGRTSRPESQVGDNRMTLTMSRLSGLMRTSKEPLVEPPKLDITGASSPGPSVQGETSESNGDAAAAKEGSGHVKVDEPPKEAKEVHHTKDFKDLKHKRGKSKEKNSKDRKTKAASQPERECVVM
ncbi:ubiquitin carboxyl-terminal hydrolase domain-containing protein [Sarocladium implicatum]|nr:ubiquitin carboxyl-terminal hydrolase domain-containing protein [Sarocladium implicatum]